MKLFILIILIIFNFVNYCFSQNFQKTISMHGSAERPNEESRDNKVNPNATFKDILKLEFGVQIIEFIFYIWMINNLKLIQNINSYSDHEIAFEVMHPFVGNEISKNKLREIIADTLIFDFPILPINDKIATLELFHGPTLAFKDVGARFMARCLRYANEIKLNNVINCIL